MRVPHVFQQNIPVLKFLLANLTGERGTLSAIESKMAPQRFLLQIGLLTSSTTVSDVFMVEHLQFGVLLESSSVKSYACKNIRKKSLTEQKSAHAFGYDTHTDASQTKHKNK